MDGASLKIMSAALPLVKQKIPPSQINWLRNGKPLEFKIEQKFFGKHVSYHINHHNLNFFSDHEPCQLAISKPIELASTVQ